MDIEDQIICIIPARAGSKGIKNKNIIPFNGLPLIAWTIKAAKKSKYIDRVIVSTEDLKISKIAKEYGAEVPFLRPKGLAKDDIHASKVILNTLQKVQKSENFLPKYVMMLLPTSPLRSTFQIDESIEIFKKNRSPSLISVTDTRKLYENLRYILNGKLKTFSDIKKLNIQRQNKQKLFVVNGSIYLAKTEKFIKEKTFHMKNPTAYEMNFLQSIDINNFEDLAIARKLIKK